MTSWIELHFVGTRSAFYLSTRPSATDHAAAILLTLLLGALFTASIRWARRLPPRAGAVLCLVAAAVVAAVALNALRIYTLSIRLGGLPTRHPALSVCLATVALFAATLLTLRWWPQALKVAAVGSLLLAPFTLWMCARSGLAIAAEDAQRETPSLAGRLPEPRSSRVAVWLIFDELDYGVAFSRRPTDLELPEFDRLRREGLFASNAAPAGAQTIVSMTSLIVGQRLLTVEPETDTDFSGTPEGGGRPISSPGSTSLFRRVREHGHDTWVVGWALPYCRTWAGDLSGCVWEPAFTTILGRSGTAAGSLLDQARAISPLNRRRLAVEGYTRVTAAAEEELRRPAGGLHLVHLPVPHPPPIYDRTRDSLSVWETSPVQGYFGNLVLADRTLGRLRRAMEESGAWDGATVLATADHPWRQSPQFDGKRDRRVPFLLKLAGQREGSAYDAELDTVRTGPLLLAILDGRIKDPSDVVSWLDRRRAPASR